MLRHPPAPARTYFRYGKYRVERERERKEREKAAAWEDGLCCFHETFSSGAAIAKENSAFQIYNARRERYRYVAAAAFSGRRERES